MSERLTEAQLRGLLWFAWNEFNAIQARSGAVPAMRLERRAAAALMLGCVLGAGYGLWRAVGYVVGW